MFGLDSLRMLTCAIPHPTCGNNHGIMYATLQDMIALDVAPNLRLQRLLYRKPKKLEEAQLLVLRRAVQYGE